jgi:heme oxygenase
MLDTQTMLGQTSLGRRLERGTAMVHRRLEAKLGLLDPDLDIGRYRRVIETFYGFYVPLEAAAARQAALAGPLEFSLRVRSVLIKRDLLALGIVPAEITELPQCADLPALSSIEDLAGCLYVLEGACLGGQILAPLLHRRLGITKGTGTSFFAGDEERTKARWTVIVAWIEGLPGAGASTARIIVAALATFEAFERWAEAGLSHG